MRFSCAIIGALVLSGAAFAQDTTSVADRLDEQTRRIEALEDKLEHTAPSNSAATTSSVLANAGASGFSLQSADKSNVIRFGANVAVDGHWFSDRSTPSSANTWLLRKARPIISGTVNDIFDFRLMPDFGNGKTIIQDAYIAARLRTWAIVQAGKFKAPVGLERLQLEQYSRFIEAGLPSDLVPYRSIGLQFAGAPNKGAISYAIGYFDNALDGASSDNNTPSDASPDGKKDLEARFFLQPFLNTDLTALRGLGVGVSGTYANFTGTGANPLLPSYKTPGQQTFFAYRSNTAAVGAPNNASYADGERKRWMPQAYYYVGNFGLIGEYVKVAQDVSRQLSTTAKNAATLNNSAWQVSTFFFLTGEKELYNGFVPKKNFAIGHPGWGAFEIMLRFHQLTIDESAFAGGSSSFADPTTQPSKATALGGGVIWYFNQNVKWQLNYERTKFDGGAPGGADRPQENAIFTRFALTF